ncbi:helix-turn-helix domain-containing protein [Pseudomonas sp. DTU_2021_1001937_2_SI_NGA_ILE_001]|uniref:RodZ family helix-turn-helix domain-containing protein n=1 Tax=Pseudomonas sp. DTU_2021_1001937_2_SI_NGA_ILE_001 TaxID=3077589 RepID=UPI0028FC0C47|nr:RodZ family helix-turn-helix domain-containing protein [Pseudomonas sp. DTU_2021_1001937_2_SI_NGA_ILE_001]WNW13665.1 helix-turn-helix domain-containing protein [Pseudomonas sp. DTU_2021_1001937_2_SI_NGA_ILE_001]
MKTAHPEVVAAHRANPGETLRQAREHQNWSLPDVAHRLNLTVSSLNHVENGDFDRLPGHTFARGYVRAYAKLLGLDQAALVAQFDQYTGTDGKGSEVHSLGRIEEPVRLSHNILRIVSLLLLLVLVGGGFLWWQDQAAQRGKDLTGLVMEHVEVESADGTTQIHPIDEPQQPAPAPAQASEGGSAPLPLNPSSTAAPAPESIASAPAPAVQAPGAPSTTPATPAAQGSSTQQASSAPSVAHTPAGTAPAAPSAPASSEPIAPILPGSAQVTMKFTADCWTQVTDGNGKVLVSALKRKGENLEVSGKPPFSVRLGFARGAEVSYNGQPVDVAPFTTGETARLKLGQ